MATLRLGDIAPDAKLKHPKAKPYLCLTPQPNL